jgi:HNH endonuclease
MTAPLLDRSQFGPPEHFDDEIRAYKSSTRYIPTPLESILFELAGHRCTICNAPWLEIHHIEELADGGSTEYDNLIVLCPNCHTRVHSEAIPSKEELKHYKKRQEIAYELPVLSRLSSEERAFIKDLACKTREQQIVFSKRVHEEITAASHGEAVEKLKHRVGYFELQESGMVTVDLGNSIGMGDGKSVSVSLQIQLTGKGIKWIRYLQSTNRVPES